MEGLQNFGGGFEHPKPPPIGKPLPRITNINKIDIRSRIKYLWISYYTASTLYNGLLLKLETKRFVEEFCIKIAPVCEFVASHLVRHAHAVTL